MFLLLRRLLTVVYLMTHPVVPVRLKALPLLAFLYLVFPRDLWFDFRAFGFLDDFIVGGLLIGTFVSKGWDRVLAAQHKRDDTIPAEFRVVNDDDPASTEGAPSTPDGEPVPDGDPSSGSEAQDTGDPPSADLRG